MVVSAVHGKQVELMKMAIQPFLIGRSVPGACDAIAKLTENDDRNCRSRLPTQEVADDGIASHERRQRVGVEHHRRSSGPMTWNAWSIFACIC
jgi:hypothetical protein